MIFKDFSENELYLFMNGKLIYKRWLDTGVSKVFDIMAYDKYTLASIKELGNENGLFIINARIKLTPTEQGGRKTRSSQVIDPITSLNIRQKVNYSGLI